MEVDIILERKDGKQFKFPVIPAEFEVAGGSGNQTIETIKQGEVTVFGKRKLRSFNITSFFTANEAAPYCRTKGAEYKEPIECVRELLEIQELEEPVSFITTGLDMKAFWVTLENVTWGYQPGTQDINFSADFKEYRPYGQSAKKYETVVDVFNLKKETKVLEGAGGRREPTDWAIGDNVVVSGLVYEDPTGPIKGLLVIADRPSNYLLNAWTAAQAEIYKAMKTKEKILQGKQAVIIDIVKTQIVAGVEMKSGAPYCIADAKTKNRIGWVNGTQMARG
ncbi:MAG: hypothetical protein MJZ10_11885 [Fibrobacter sp.]|nr:hypothetical protein [Fibrobacter sp.]